MTFLNVFVKNKKIVKVQFKLLQTCDSTIILFISFANFEAFFLKRPMLKILLLAGLGRQMRDDFSKGPAREN